MGIWAKQLLVLLLPLLVAAAFAATDELENPDFELPPSNIIPSSNSSTISFLPLNSSINSIPGWSYQGNVAYVTSFGGPGGGNGSHAIYLGVNGKINQTITTSSDEESMHYLLSFTLAVVADQENCTGRSAGGVIITVRDRSCSVSFEQKFGKEMWQNHACYLGSYGDGEVLNLIIETQQPNSNISNHDDSNSSSSSTTCGPILDILLLKKIEYPIKSTDENNLLVNGGFEFGPDIPYNSVNGVLMEEEAPSPAQSPLIQWGIIGTVKYITSNENYTTIIQEGKAAIQILSRRNSPSGVQTTVTLQKGSTYSLDFTIIGHATDGCVGDFNVGVQAGSKVFDNITMPSSLETGSTRGYSMIFKADSIVTPISFLSFKTIKTLDSVYCGPVIDRVVLYDASSYGLKLELSFMVLFSCPTFLVTIL